MTAINVIRYANGRTLYPCGTWAFPPTNPKMGITVGNTVTWNEKTHAATVIIPREHPVNLDSWAPQSKLRSYSGPVVYGPPFPRTVAVPPPAPTRTTTAKDSCPVTFPGLTLCGT